MISIDAFLDRLQKVKPVGQSRWKACCPAHEEKTPSLSIRQADDGRILLHCFGQDCDAVDIAAAVGLRIHQLLPDRATYMRPHERGTNITNAQASDFLEMLDHEAMCVWLLATDMTKSKRALSDEEWKRLTVAVRRINDARAIIKPARPTKRRSP